MCGLAGLIDLGGRLNTEDRCALVGSMRDRLMHRGPDEPGLLDLPEIGCTLGHRRLRVIDLTEAGSQPMRSRCGRFVISYNGEVYNTNELRDRLDDRVELRGHCDTEIVLEYLGAFGTDSIGDLNGMFALALLDLKKHTLTLARDRFGKKPLYYASGEDWFGFSSELTALGLVPRLDRGIDAQSVASYLLLQYVPAPHTIYQGARKLAPGCTLTVTFDRAHSTVHVGDVVQFFDWHPADPSDAALIINGQQSLDDAVELFEELFDAAVARRMVSDVPLGVFLSGGIDSALVADSMVRMGGEQVNSFSIGFAGSRESEHVEARSAAATIGTVHHDEIIDPDVVELLPALASHLDEPLGDSGALPMWCLAQMTRKHVTVALSGDGGDELMGGYQRYLETLRECAWPWRKWRWRMRTGQRYDVGKAYCSERFWMIMPQTIESLMGSLGSRTAALAQRMRHDVACSSQSLIHRLRDVDTHSYLPGAVLTKVDRMTMAHSLESRSPFLDPSIARLAASLPADWCATPWSLKVLLREVVRKRLPSSWARRPKRGFGLPSAGWSRDDLLTMCDDLLCGPDARCTALLESSALRQWVHSQRDERRFSVFQVWTMLMLELWWRSHEATCAQPPVLQTTRLTARPTAQLGAR